MQSNDNLSKIQHERAKYILLVTHYFPDKGKIALQEQRYLIL